MVIPMPPPVLSLQLQPPIRVLLNERLDEEIEEILCTPSSPARA
jgi:hypothetical protein